jgi:hypothetical protein
MASCKIFGSFHRGILAFCQPINKKGVRRMALLRRLPRGCDAPGVVFSKAAIHVHTVVVRPHKPHRCPGSLSSMLPPLKTIFWGCPVMVSLPPPMNRVRSRMIAPSPKTTPGAARPPLSPQTDHALFERPYLKKNSTRHCSDRICGVRSHEALGTIPQFCERRNIRSPPPGTIDRVLRKAAWPDEVALSLVLPVTLGVVFSEAAIFVHTVVAGPHKPHGCPE